MPPHSEPEPTPQGPLDGEGTSFFTKLTKND
jgi:hypothetical protein